MSLVDALQEIEQVRHGPEEELNQGERLNSSLFDIYR